MSDTAGDARNHQNPAIDGESPAPGQQPDGGEIVDAREKSPDSEEMTAEELEAERQRRLDPENRPEATEVDNTDRTFDPISGTFEDEDRDAVNAPFADPSESV